jgi:hypothetical protein
MEVIFDDDYERLAAEFQYEQVRLLKDALKRHGVPTEVAKQVCGDFTFDLAMLLDQGEINVNGETYSPCLAFMQGENGPLYAHTDEVEFHEYAFGTAADVYRNEKP